MQTTATLQSTDSKESKESKTDKESKPPALNTYLELPCVKQIIVQDEKATHARLISTEEFAEKPPSKNEPPSTPKELSAKWCEELKPHAYLLNFCDFTYKRKTYSCTADALKYGCWGRFPMHASTVDKNLLDDSLKNPTEQK